MANEGASCPLCTGTLDRPELIHVCHSCHESLQLSGAIPVTRTGEFAAMPESEASRILAGTPSHAATAAEDLSASCSWCGKSRTAVKKLLARGRVYICNECVSLCADILSVELGDDWQR